MSHERREEIVFIGLRGPKGDKGDVGPTGLRGIQGQRGLQGERGVPGSQGIKGDVGNQGPQGVQGLKGEQGQPGLSAPKIGRGSVFVNKASSVSVLFDAPFVDAPKVVATIKGGNQGDNKFIRIDNISGRQ